MTNYRILAREVAILLGASILLALSYNAFSPKPLDLIRTETTSMASDSLIMALVTTTTAQKCSSLQDSTAVPPLNNNVSQSLSQKAATPAIQKNNTPVSFSEPSQQPLSGSTSTPLKSESAKTTDAAKSNSSSQTIPQAAETSKTESTKPIKALEIRTDQVEKLLANPDVLFIDARPSHEYQLGHIGNAINIFTPEFEQNIPRIIGLPREKPIVAYCGGGACELSHELAENLIKMGFQRVFVYVGGWNEWKQRK